HFAPTLAATFVRGRVLLAGDAARTTFPLGVQGLNRGLSDAWQMVSEIAAVTSGRRPATVLEALGASQRQEWQRSIENVDFELLPQAPSWLAGHAQQVVSGLPVSGPDLEELLRQLGLLRR
ncbi:MAG: FAD-dependent monooxygenase, partial [Polyangiaceae bacterium]